MYQEFEKQRTIKPWRKWEEEYLFDNIRKKPIEEICAHLGRNERSVNLFLHRHKYDPRLLTDTLLLRILKLKFGDPRLFNPNRDFYQAIKMGQKRFNGILKGDWVMKDEECKRITDFFDIPYESVQEVRQTELFADEK